MTRYFVQYGLRQNPLKGKPRNVLLVLFGEISVNNDQRIISTNCTSTYLHISVQICSFADLIWSCWADCTLTVVTHCPTPASVVHHLLETLHTHLSIDVALTVKTVHTSCHDISYTVHAISRQRTPRIYCARYSHSATTVQYKPHRSALPTPAQTSAVRSDHRFTKPMSIGS